MEKWRCRLCETFNDNGNNQCIVCSTEKYSPAKSDRWRCRLCETLNDNGNNQCIVCGTDRNKPDNIKKIVRKKPEDIPLNIRECKFSGCGSPASDGSDFCEYHKINLCPVCHEKIKSTGMDFCIDCAMDIVEQNTSGLRKINTTFRILDIFSSATFVTLLMLYIFYFS